MNAMAWVLWGYHFYNGGFQGLTKGQVSQWGHVPTMRSDHVLEFLFLVVRKFTTIQIWVADKTQVINLRSGFFFTLAWGFSVDCYIRTWGCFGVSCCFFSVWILKIKIIKSVILKLINIFNQLGSLKRYVTKINNNLHAGVVLIELLSPYLYH